MKSKKKAKQKRKMKSQRTDWWLPYPRDKGQTQNVGEGGQKIQTSGFQISKSWGSNVQLGNYS